MRTKLKQKIVAGAIVIATAVTMTGCTLFGQNTTSNSNSHSTTKQQNIIDNYDFSKCLTDTFLTEEEIKSNCEKFGIDYNDLNINSPEMKKNAYLTTNNWKDENTEGTLMQRAIFQTNNYLKIYYDSSVSQKVKNAISIAVQEINKIGYDIGDPVQYYAQEATASTQIRPFDVYITNGEIGNSVSKFEYEFKEINGNNICYNMVISLNKGKIITFSNSEIERIILYELAAHVCTMQEDAYVSKDKEIKSSKILNSGDSITTGSQNLTSGDILLRAAKYCGNLNREKVNDIIDYAKSYGSKNKGKTLSEISSLRLTEDLLTLNSLMGLFKIKDFSGSLNFSKSAADLLYRITDKKSEILSQIQSVYDESIDESTSIREIDVNDGIYLKATLDNSESYFQITPKSFAGKIFKLNGEDYIDVDSYNYETSMRLLGNDNVLKIGDSIQAIKTIGDYVYLIGYGKDVDGPLSIKQIGEVITEDEYKEQVAERYEKMYEFIASQQEMQQ